MHWNWKKFAHQWSMYWWFSIWLWIPHIALTYSFARAYTQTHTHTHFYLLAPFLCTFLWYYYFYTIFVFSLCVCECMCVCLSVCFLYISLVIKPSKWFCATCGFDTPPLQIFFYNTYFYIERIWLSLRIFSSLYMNIYIYICATIYTSLNQMYVWCSRNFITEKLHHINL